jgi:thioredoxin reductase (NADPH)
MYDTIIIGSGPAGLTAAIYAQRAQLKAVVVEKVYMGTGQIAESERVDNYPGLYGKNGFDLGDEFRNHALALGTEFYEGEVSKILPEENGYSVEFSDGKSLNAATIIYSAGAKHRKLDIVGEAEFTGRGVSYCAVCDGAFYKGKTVAVVGGGDTALGDALLLSKIADKVYLIHRREQFRANKTLQSNVKNTPNIELVLNAVPVEIMGEKKVNAVKISQDNGEKNLSIDGIFVAVGELPESALLQGIAELDERGYVVAGEDGATSADGIFVAGDVRTKQLRQVVTAAADGANCVTSVEKYLELI